MKALTLHQPWASLVALGVKTIETRSWPCPPSLIGQPLAIHAGARWGMERNVKGHEWHGWSDSLCGLCFAEDVLNVDAVDVPLGAVVATCRVVACVPTVDVLGAEQHPGPFVEVGQSRPYLGIWRPGASVMERIDDQLPYGDFSPGRSAWLLEDVKPTTVRCPACWGTKIDTALLEPFPCRHCLGSGHCPPVPARGRQRVWNWEV